MVLKMTRIEMMRKMPESAKPPVFAILAQEAMVSMAVSLVL